MTAILLDETHDPARRSWVGSAQGATEFPIQNLPLGVFSPPGGAPRGGIAIGDEILALEAALAAGLLSGDAERAAIAAAGATLNPFMALGTGPRNDWSARDIQRWEMPPLGPFLAKNFGTTVSPWVVTIEALAPFRQAQPPRPQGDPRPLPYLWNDTDQQQGAFDVELEALIATDAMRTQGRAPYRLALSNAAHLYWTLAQMVAHHACGGCNLQPGDLIGTGTISAPGRSGFGSFAEISDDGVSPLALPSGETRTFLEDGDELILRATARREGFVSIGFGECRGRIAPAPR